MIDSCPVKIDEAAVVATPARNNLMQSGEGKLFIDKRQKVFHTCVAKVIFIGKRSRPDIQPTISILSSCVRAPTVQALEKLVILCKYLNCTNDLCLVFSIDDMKVIKWFIDASYAVHEDFCSHSGLATKFRQGSAISASPKQKLNTRFSTEAELVRVDDFMGMIIWTHIILEAQGYGVFKHIMYQDNIRTIYWRRMVKHQPGKELGI